MALSPGALLGPFQILHLLGTGGMGEVYKARDTRLDRIVALKVSPEKFNDRFQREARAVAALNHPNICTLHDVGPNYLVMEYVEGTPLGGPLPVDQALAYGIQIAGALDHAHRRGIVHRDLKPANIMVTAAGVKLLDFGLAKIAETPAGEFDVTRADTLTQLGTLVGTPQYMAPEQVEGEPTDGRTDIFSFGVVLYESLVGKTPFEGKSMAGIMAAILTSAPPSVAASGTVLPPALDRVIRKCMAKRPDDRWQSARDLRDELQWIADGCPKTPAEEPPRPRRTARERRAMLGWVVSALALLVAAVFAFLWWRAPVGAPGVTRFAIHPPPGTNFVSGVPAISPDGRRIAFLAMAKGGGPMIYVRPLDSLEARPAPGTEGVSRSGAQWSRDGRSLIFLDADNNLRVVDFASGSSRLIAESVGAEGFTWNADGVVLYTASDRLIHRIPLAGGTPSAATRLDEQAGEVAHSLPQFFPDGKRFLYLAGGREPGAATLKLAALDAAESRALPAGNGRTIFTAKPRGYLLYVQGTTLMAQPFDERRLRLEGAPAVVADRVANLYGGLGAFSVSDNGVLAYLPSQTQDRATQLTWYDRDGNPLGDLSSASGAFNAVLSPDGQRVAWEKAGSGGAPREIWITDLARNASARFTSGPVAKTTPVWSPDGRRIAYVVSDRGKDRIYEKDIAGGPERVLVAGAVTAIDDWSRDGQRMLYFGEFRLNIVTLGGDRKSISLAPPGKFFTGHGRFSPDGKYVAYTSTESGRFEVYVREAPPGERRWQVSVNGGFEAHWRADGQELFYLSTDAKMMSVEVKPGPAFEPGATRALFQTPIPGIAEVRNQYSVSPDGRRFLISAAAGAGNDAAIVVVENWHAALQP
ncbi:MAG: serine/threonine-protein kinase [Bryobacteraceae bacterium]|nr:serine/threonine-protein kinase [Bryobacteraceae bacterium]